MKKKKKKKKKEQARKDSFGYCKFYGRGGCGAGCGGEEVEKCKDCPLKMIHQFPICETCLFGILRLFLNRAMRIASLSTCKPY